MHGAGTETVPSSQFFLTVTEPRHHRRSRFLSRTVPAVPLFHDIRPPEQTRLCRTKRQFEFWLPFLFGPEFESQSILHRGGRTSKTQSRGEAQEIAGSFGRIIEQLHPWRRSCSLLVGSRLSKRTAATRSVFRWSSAATCLAGMWRAQLLICTSAGRLSCVQL